MTSTAINLLAGDYTVIVEDSNGCTEEASVIIAEPPALVLDTQGTDPDCNIQGWNSDSDSKRRNRTV